MSGRVVGRAQPVHHCSPGWDEVDGYMHRDHTVRVGDVWRCDCGRHWVAERDLTPGAAPASVTFRVETKREARRRLRGEPT